ncbi:MAG: ribulose-phosphate 3-epimerase [Pirellulales bacterium]
MSRWNSTQLKCNGPAILPSILLCDFTNLEREVQRLEAAEATALHLDVMDGNFVPNLTYGMPIVEAFRKLTDLPLDVHLMIEKPARYIRQFYEAGADLICIHQEATEEDTRDVLEQIKALGAAAGIAINPDTPTEKIEEYFDIVDLVLIMSVNAGFGGQKFNPAALDKIKRVRELAPSHVLIEVDGGVNAETINPCTEAGADLLVVGSAIFGEEDYANAMRQLNQLAEITSDGLT